MREHSPTLVEQAHIVAQELIRVAILWSEMWYEGLEEASRFYTERDMAGMFATLTPLHDQLDDVGASATAVEAEFVENFGEDLTKAWEWCRAYRRTGNQKDITAAWDHYYAVYRRIRKLLPQLASLKLKDVSPKLYGGIGRR